VTAPAVLIVNPNASRVTPEVVAAVERELGYVDTVLTERPGHAAELAERACGTASRIYVLSGDGGFNEVVNGLDGIVPVGFLPGGGTSVVPRALGLPRDPVEAARELSFSERVRRIALGVANGRRFLFSAGLGLDAELVRAVDTLGRRTDGRRPGDAAFARELLRILAARRGRFRPALTVLEHGRAAFVLVANGDPYSYVGRVPLHVAPEARFELGLDLVAPRDVRARDLIRLAWWTLIRPRRDGGRGLIAVHDADGVEIECDVPTPLQADGEDLGDVSFVRFEAERDALSVLVSARDSA
jgi:diacylglycerol kinase family enzyme